MTSLLTKHLPCIPLPWIWIQSLSSRNPNQILPFSLVLLWLIWLLPRELGCRCLSCTLSKSVVEQQGSLRKGRRERERKTVGIELVDGTKRERERQREESDDEQSNPELTYY